MAPLVSLPKVLLILHLSEGFHSVSVADMNIVSSPNSPRVCVAGGKKKPRRQNVCWFLLLMFVAEN